MGENYLCSILENDGFKVIYPEELSIFEQLRIYYNAKILVFTEGSAIHTLQLLGRVPTKVYVINRRRGSYVGKWQLSYRVSSVSYIDVVLNEEPRLTYIEPLLPTFLNFDLLIEKLYNEGILSKLNYNKKIAKKYIHEDLQNILSFYEKNKLTFAEEIKRYIREESERLGIFEDGLEQKFTEFIPILSIIREKEFMFDNLRKINNFYRDI